MGSYIPIILGVLKDVRVIGTIVVMLIVVEFARYIADYSNKPKKKKPKKAKAAAPASAPAKPEPEDASGGAE